MAYTLLEKGHTVSATDFDNNYKHVGQGHLLPHGGSLLEETTGVYDLGSDAYKWNDVHVQNLEIQSGGEVQHCMNLIAETTLTTTATSIEFTGLNDVPVAGDRFFVVEDDKVARQFAERKFISERNDAFLSRREK